MGKKKLKRVQEGFDQVKRKGWFWKVWVRRSNRQTEMRNGKEVWPE